jgi:hypothetical protein
MTDALSHLFGGGGGSQAPTYLPPPPPPPTPPTLADASKAPGAAPSASLIGAMGGTNATGGTGLQTEASTTRKSLLGD